MLFHSPLLEPLFRLSAERPVLLFGKKKAPFLAGDLMADSNVLAQNLAHAGLRENDVVVLTLPGGREFMTLMYALIMLRTKIAIIDPEMGRTNFSAKLKQLQPSWAFVDSRILLLNEHPILRAIVFYTRKNVPYFRTPKNCTVVSTGIRLPLVRRYKTWRSLFAQQPQPVGLQPDPGPHEFLIVYTSGTLQEPKGVVHSFVNLNTSIQHLTKIVGYQSNDVIGTDLPQYMMLGVCTGIPVRLKPAGLPAAAYIDWIESNAISVLFSPPSELLSLVRQCEEQHRKLPACLRRVLLGSAPVHKSFLQRLKNVASDGLQITSLYGMTELLICATIDCDEKINHESDGDVLGKPWADVQCSISDDGEILLQSPQLFSRYFHEATRNDLHATGDTGYLDSSGYLVLTGRKKDMIIRNGFNIYPVIYETMVKQIPGVDDCAMVGIWNESRQDEDVYLVVETALPVSTIRKEIERGMYAIDAQALPDRIVHQPLPRSGRQQKVDKKTLRDQLR